jgi:hypothetical protein
MRCEDFTGQGILEDAYSYETPSWEVGNCLVNGLIEGGLTKEQAITVFYSKHYRWSLNGSLGEALRKIAYLHGQKLAQELKDEDWLDEPLPDNVAYALQRHNEIEERA